MQAAFFLVKNIFERLRGIEYDGQDRSIDVRISRIRPKLVMILKIQNVLKRYVVKAIYL